MFVVNGQAEGPLIEANKGIPPLPLLRFFADFFFWKGDTLVVNVQNNLNTGVTLHWHVRRFLSTPFIVEMAQSCVRRELLKTEVSGQMDPTA